MLKGATGKRIYYFMSSLFRFVCFIGFLVAFIIVKCTVNPSIDWLNILLISLSIGGLLSSIFNLGLCGMTATGYRSSKAIQVVCLIFTICTGGIIATTFTAIACGMKVTDEEIENENIFKVKKYKGNNYAKKEK